jgi:hypothetical protein
VARGRCCGALAGIVVMIIRALKRLLPASLLLFAGCRGDSASSAAPKLSGFSLRWVHPRLANPQAVTVSDPNAAMKLATAFEDYYRPLKGVPYDCPMYDVVVTLHAADGTSTDLKVYLPRAHLFPGMWKHPSGPLVYFEVEKSEQKVLVDILRPYIPDSPVYPRVMTNWPPVEFSKGIPDLRQVDYPVSGDFSPSDFVHGGQR